MTPPPQPGGPSRRGLTLLEVAISLALLVGLLVPIYLLLVRAREHAGETRYQRLARAAAEHEVERMREVANRGGASFGTIPGVFDGRRFAVPGLPPRRDGSAAPHGQVEVLLDESATGVDLDGTDLDGDGDFGNDALPATARFRALPVRISVWWGTETTPKLVLDAVVAKRTDYLRSQE